MPQTTPTSPTFNFAEISFYEYLNVALMNLAEIHGHLYEVGSTDLHVNASLVSGALLKMKEVYDAAIEEDLDYKEEKLASLEERANILKANIAGLMAEKANG